MRRPSRRGEPGPEGKPDLRTVVEVAPYLWPDGEREIKFRVVAALIFLVLAKVATVATPFFYKAAVDALAPTDGGRPTEATVLALPVLMVLAYGAARVMTSGFQQLRDAVFARVAQRGLRRLALRTFQHIHALSLRFHITRKTGGLSRIIERGVKGVEFLLRFMLFSLVPLGIELLLVAGIFFVEFNAWYFLVVVVTIGIYTAFTFKVTEWRVKIRRRMNKQDTEANQKAVDSLLNFETVKYFSAERREAERYDQSMAGYEDAAIQTSKSLAFLNFGQAFLITCGLIVVMGMAAFGVSNGTLTVGDFVMVNAFMIQITMPLNFLGTVYREIRQALVDMREMFDLLGEPAEVEDKSDATPLDVSSAAVEFDGVGFAYDPDRQILHDVSFSIPGGKSLAIVGPSGSGKSTISRLLFRFYDVSEGAIRIDGQDIRDVTQESLRARIGVVPQDTVLFNDTIGYNIAYGRPGATPEEVEHAARSARIHNFVQSLPERYDTVVGERGLKLSGGEKQRVAIARTILKNPPILILDEATSALDTQTERAIQGSLKALAENRTTVTIAHRLSTIVDADEIIVLEAGRIVERGRHADLVNAGGRYAAMWARQEAEEEAEVTEAAE